MRWTIPDPALAILIALTTPALGQAIAGPARVVDGDTLEVSGAHVRLEGIDAPERGQTCRRGPAGEGYRCGLAASAALARLIAGRPVRCGPTGTDRYGRTLAVCWAGQTDIGAALVRSGWALAYVRYSTRYVGEEAEARAAGRGMWGGTFQPPWDWRREHRGGH